jgi:hypothetical protein
MVADTIVLDFMDEELWHLLAAEESGGFTGAASVSCNCVDVSALRAWPLLVVRTPVD